MTDETQKFVNDILTYLSTEFSYKGFDKENLETIFLRSLSGVLPHQKFPVGSHVFVTTERMYYMNTKNTEKHCMTHVINNTLCVLGIVQEYNYLFKEPYRVKCFYKNNSDPEFNGDVLVKRESEMILVSEVLENPFVD